MIQVVIHCKLVWFGLVWFHGISNIVGYLMSNPFYKYEQFYFKRFSLAQEHNLVLFYLCATTPGKNEPGSDANKWVLRIHKATAILEALPSYFFFFEYPRHTLGESYPSAKMQLLCSAAPVDWAIVNLI